MKQATIQLETFACPSCILKVEGALKALDGIDQDSVNVSFNSSRVRLNFNEEEVSIEDMETAITKVGYEVKRSRVK